MPGSHEHDDMKPAPSGVGMKLTYDDFLLFPDDGKRHELIDGEHYVTPSPNTKHQRVAFDVVFTKFDVVEPDLLYLSNERAAKVVTSDHVTGAPEIVVEIGSPATRTRDETIKRRLSDRSGVSEYWIVDPELDVVRVYRRVDSFTRPQEFSREADDVVTSEHLPGLELRLLKIFEG
jgi:Uma2 family endonuclease